MQHDLQVILSYRVALTVPNDTDINEQRVKKLAAKIHGT